jgi:calcium-dependent protein kinase
VLQGKYDYRCDIWSLGVLCYMMLSGSPPFYGKTVDDVYAATLSQEAVFPDKKFKHVSGVCMDFMKRLLVKDPHQRMSTAEALAHPFITGGLAAPPAFPSMPGSLPPSASARGASGPLPSVVAESIIQSMLRFAGADPLTKLVLEMVGHSLCPDHTRALCDEFQAIDRANNGALSLQAFSSGLISAPSVSNGLVDISMVFNAIAISRAHGHGQLLTFHEYIAAAMVHRIDIEEERVLLVFNSLDPGEPSLLSVDLGFTHSPTPPSSSSLAEHTGFVSVESMQKSLGEDISTLVLQAIVSAADKNNDGLITQG